MATQLNKPYFVATRARAKRGVREERWPPLATVCLATFGSLILWAALINGCRMLWQALFGNG